MSVSPVQDDRKVPRRLSASVEAAAVFGDADLLECILVGNVGLAAFVAVRQINTATRAICAESKALVRAAALHGGGLNKRQFVGLFSMNYQEGSRYPHVRSGRRHFFEAVAIDQALARPDSMLLMRLNATCSRYERETYLRQRYGGSRGCS